MKNDAREFLKLVAENPDLPIYGLVNGEVVGDDGGYWLGSFGSAHVGEIAAYNDRFFDDDREGFKEEYCYTHEDELYERFQYAPYINEYALKQGRCTAAQLAINNENEKALEKYLDEVAEKYFVKAIVVYIGTPDELIVD